MSSLPDGPHHYYKSRRYTPIEKLFLWTIAVVTSLVFGYSYVRMLSGMLSDIGVFTPEPALVDTPVTEEQTGEGLPS